MLKLEKGLFSWPLVKIEQGVNSCLKGNLIQNKQNEKKIVNDGQPFLPQSYKVINFFSRYRNETLPATASHMEH